MKYKERDHIGSFAARGAGFLYDFDAHIKNLHISRAGSYAPLIYLELDRQLAADPLEYIHLIDKAAQIKALKFSGNTTINLAETLDDGKLTAILAWALRLGQYGFNLKRENFSHFQRRFILDHALKRLEIRRMDGYTHLPFYLASLETAGGDSVSTRSSTLHGVLAYLADKITRDIISHKFGQNVDSCVYQLLNTASILTSLSFILNDRFEPRKKLKSDDTFLGSPTLKSAKMVFKTIN